MKITATIPAGDYTSTKAWIEVPCGIGPGGVLLKRIRVFLDNNANAGEIGIYQYAKNTAAIPSDNLLAQAEEFYDDNVLAKTAPIPELNLTPSEDVPLEFINGNSFYVTYLATGVDNAVSGTVDIWLESLEG